MNIAERILESENSLLQTLHGWRDAYIGLQSYSWNPQGLNEVDLIMSDDKYGLHCSFDHSGLILTCAIYHIPEVAPRPEYVDEITTLEDGGMQTTSRPAFEFDEKYFVKDELKVAERKFNLKSIFGKDWITYLDSTSQTTHTTSGRSPQKIEEKDRYKQNLHAELADKIGQKFKQMGLTHIGNDQVSMKSLINLVLDYYFRFGNAPRFDKEQLAVPSAQPS